MGRVFQEPRNHILWMVFYFTRLGMMLIASKNVTGPYAKEVHGDPRTNGWAKDKRACVNGDLLI